MKSPGQLADERLQEAYEYAKLGERLSAIKQLKAEQWPKIRDKSKSIAEADRTWEMSDLGVEERQIKIKMDVKAQKISALRTKIETAHLEARNQY